MSKHGKKNKGGRPTVMTPDVLQKLEDAFTNAFTDKMACLYAGISERTLYEYCEANPEYSQRKELLKNSPDLIAQKQLIAGLNTTQGARWWAEHRMEDFRPKSEVKHSGKIQTQDVTELTPEQKEDIAQLQKIKAQRRKEARAKMT